MKKPLVLLAFFIIGFAAANAAARADCGAHQMSTDIAHLQSLEALPRTLKNIGNPQNAATWGNDSDHPRWTSALDLPLVRCPEDSDEMERAQRALLDMWRDGLTFQNSISRLAFMKSGAISVPRPCLSVYRAGLRAALITEWGRYVGRPMVVADMEASYGPAPTLLFRQRWFGHVKSLWQQNARQMGMSLPPIAFLNNATAEEAYEKAAASAKAHLPDGIECNVSV